MNLTWQDVVAVWMDGGMLMVPLFLLAMMIYFYALELIFYFRFSDLIRVGEETWLPWLARPEEATGEVGEIIRYTSEDCESIRDIQNRFTEVRHAHLPRINQRIVFLSVLVTVAPLMGLLGTVIGMLTTFKGLAGASGKVIDTVASGISEALITTQTGLVIAIPGYIMVYMVTRRRQELAAFLARLESMSVQHFTKENPV